MKVSSTGLNGCYIIEPKIHGDERGYFFEAYNESLFNEALGFKVSFVQDNEAFSSKGVLRGLHFQKDKFAQAKLVRVTQGSVLDVVVDLQPESSTFLKTFTIKLSSENKKQLFVPRGFAHGYIVLSDTAIFNYKCDNVYNQASESGIIYNDETLNIDWILESSEFIISEKDKILPTIKTMF
ncbi:dTDP-4-dehydrorhamnose 3,5-epimerase [Aurantibacter sp.]|uniref:dTDP-4-dehydrorhamnose 3,5-epimerase n=1 Tax=Aurantibacter sp. TaxID=2807103 RepID=UPI0035C84ABA